MGLGDLEASLELTESLTGRGDHPGKVPQDGVQCSQAVPALAFVALKNKTKHFGNLLLKELPQLP